MGKLTDNRVYREIKATIIILGIIGAILLFISSMQNKEWIFIKSFISYVSICALFFILNSFLKNKYLDKVNRIIFLPFGILWAILTFTIPFGTLLIHVMFYFSISFAIPELLYRTLKYLDLIDFIKEPTAIYLKITLTVFISVLLNSLIRRIVILISPMHVKPKDLAPYELDKLTDYLLSRDNVRFLVYTGYAIALIIINYYNFQGLSYNTGIDIDKSVLQSFVTFIAFDRSLFLMRQLNFSPSELWEKVRKSIYNMIVDYEKNSS
jgi:hypothetical protein